MSFSQNDVNSDQQGARAGAGQQIAGRYVPPHLRNRAPEPAREPARESARPATSHARQSDFPELGSTSRRDEPPRRDRDEVRRDDAPRFRDDRGSQQSRDDVRTTRDDTASRWREPTTDIRGGNFGREDRNGGGRWADSRDSQRDARGAGGFGGGGRSGGFGGSGSSGSSRWDARSSGPSRRRPTMDRNPALERQLFGEASGEGPVSHAGIDFERYNDIPVDVSGEQIPEPIGHFADGKFHEVLASNIELAGYSVPTPVQKYAVPISLSGRDLMGCAQTGSGKTAAFLLPMINLLVTVEQPPPPDGGRNRRVFPSGLILAPTRELATQIYTEANKFTYRTGLRAVVVYGGQSIGLQFRELEKGVDIIVATPGRLVDMLDRSRVSLEMIQFLIFDEADRMLDMGFEPQIRQILEKYDMAPNGSRQTSMFSATFPKEIQRLAADFLTDYIFLAVGRVGSATENITQQVIYTQENAKNDALMKILPGCEGLTLIFVETKRAATQLEYWLSDNGINATSIHGDRTQDEREEALFHFRKGHCPVLVATSVAARGLDIPNVLMVINYDLPSNIDDYVHRIGRTGRAGHRGTAIAFVNESCRILREVYDLMKESKQEIEPWFQKMASWGGGGGSSRGGGGGHGKSGGRGRYGGRDFRREEGGSRSGNFQHRSGGGGGGWGERGGDSYGGGGGGGYGGSPHAGGGGDWD